MQLKYRYSVKLYLGLLKRIYDILSNKGSGSWTAQNVNQKKMLKVVLQKISNTA